MIDPIIALFLPVYFVTFYSVVILFRVLILKHKTGLNAYSLLQKEGPESLIVFYLKLLIFFGVFVPKLYKNSNYRIFCVNYADIYN